MRDIAADIEKEYGQINFKVPIIYFGYNKIDISQKFDIFAKIFFLLFLIPVIALFFSNPPFPSIFIFIPIIFLLYIIYIYRNYFDKITIDFISKELIVENKLPLINSIRKLIKIATTVSFNDIAYFTTDDRKPGLIFPRSPINEGMRKTFLFVKPKYNAPICLAIFQFERDARRLGELLQFHVVGKPGFIK